MGKKSNEKNLKYTVIEIKLSQKSNSFKAHSQLWDNVWKLKALKKRWKMPFISPQKLFSFSRYKANFKLCDVTAWLTNNCNTHITHILRSKGNRTINFGQLIECNMRSIFIESYRKLLLLCEIMGNMCIAIVWKPICDAMNLEVNLIFLIKPFFLHDQKVVKKTETSWEQKELLRWSKKHFSSFLKEFQSSKFHKFLGKKRVQVLVQNK